MAAGGSSESRSRFEPEELRRILAHYDLGPVRSIRPLEVGAANSPKAVIESQRGRFLLKRRAPGRDDPYAVARLHQLQLALEAAGVPVAELIGTRENNSLLQVGGGVCELCTFVEGRPWARDRRDAGEAGRVLGMLHRALAGLRVLGLEEGSFHGAEHVEARLEHIVRAWAGGGDVALAERVLAMYRRAADETRLGGIDRQRRQIVHGDWHPGNLVFSAEGGATIIDFDTLRIAEPATDVAMGALQFSMPDDGEDLPTRLDADRLGGFIEGYRLATEQPDPHAALAPLMIEALIAEAALPIARTGRFGHVEGVRMLRAVERLGSWILCDGRSALPAG